MKRVWIAHLNDEGQLLAVHEWIESHEGARRLFTFIHNADLTAFVVLVQTRANMKLASMFVDLLAFLGIAYRHTDWEGP